MINSEIRATVGDFINRLKELPEDTPITLICHENDGHHINWEDATKSDIEDIRIDEYRVLNIGID